MALIACPACGEPVSSQTGRCSACRVPLGEDNRCARCLAIAAVFERTGRCVCSACGETRTRYANTVVASEAELLQAFEPAPERRLPVLAGLTGALGLACAGLAFSRALPLWLVGTASLLLLGAAVRLGLLARQRRRRVLRRRHYDMEQRIIGLAYIQDGLLTAQLVSSVLRVSLSEARELLSELVATGRARAELSDDGGEISYSFGEAKRTRGLRVRQSFTG